MAAAVAGSVPGVLLGIAVSRPLLEQGVTAKGLPPASPVYLPADIGVLAGTLAVVAAAALIPSLRAASTNAVQALAVGIPQPRGGHGWLGGGLQRLRLPRPVSLGVDDAFLRPLRAVLTVSALLIGVATLAFAVGIRSDVGGCWATRRCWGRTTTSGWTASAPIRTRRSWRRSPAFPR